MTTTSSTTLRRRRLAAAALAFPLSLAMTGAAFATGPTSESLGAARAATQATAAAEKAAADKAAGARAAADAAAAARTAASTTGSAAGAASGKSAAGATTTNTTGTHVNGNTNSSKSERPTTPVAGTPSQPLSTADKTGNGANTGTEAGCRSSAYCSNGTGVEPNNGNDSAPAKGQPCAGCVGRADNKDPQGQAPSGPVDRNAGYECDRNQGIGQANPAHTGCTGSTGGTTPPSGGGTTPACPDGSPIPPSGDVKDCARTDGNKDVCPDVPGDQPTIPCVKDDDVKDSSGKITICHATGSATNPYVLITISTNGLNGHGDHDGDIIPAPASGVCPGGSAGGGSGPVDVCPDVAGMQPMGPCATAGGGTPSTPGAGQPISGATPGQPANNPTAGVPIGGVSPNQPAANPVGMGPSTRPVILPNTAVAPAVLGTATSPAGRPAAARPRALPFTGTDATLLIELGGLLLLAGGGVLVAARRERTARAV